MSHSTRTPFFPENLDDYAPWVAEHGLTAPYGECQCGCGADTSIVKKSHARRGWRRDHPSRFIMSHHSIKPRECLDDLCLPTGIKAISLTKGKFALVDASDYEWLSQWKWYVYGTSHTLYAGYTMCLPHGGRFRIRMHRLILGVTDCEIQVDHRDGNGLNNTRLNLRIATIQQNVQNSGLYKHNTSGYKGVGWHKQREKWQARIRVNGECKYLGLYENIIDAAVAYDEAARKYYGEFARLNFEDKDE